KINDRFVYDPIREEIVFHSKLMQQYVLQFVGKTRQVNKVSNFFQTKYRYGIPPFFVRGPMGTGKSSLICRGLQKFLTDSGNTTSSSSGNPLIVLRFLGRTPESSSVSGLLKSMCQQIRRVNSSYAGPENRLSTMNLIEPVAVKEIFGPFQDPDYVRNDISALVHTFRECLKTATTKRPIFIVLLGLHRLQKDDSMQPLAWLPIEDNLPNVHIACSMSDEDSSQWDYVKHRLDAALAFMAASNLELFGETIVTLEPFDIPSCHLLLNRWTRKDNRSLTFTQRRDIVATATANSITPTSTGTATSQSTNAGNSTPWLIRMHYLFAREWNSWSKYPALSGNVTKLAEDIFAHLERRHGVAIIGRISRLLLLTRDGVSESELEDLLSIDLDVITESVAYQIQSTSPLCLTPVQPIPRVSPSTVYSVLADLVGKYEVMIWSVNWDKGPMLLRWANSLFKDIATKRYLHDTKIISATCNDLASYFNNDWCSSHDDQGGSSPSHTKDIPSFNIVLKPEHWKGVVQPHKLLPHHSTTFITSETSFSVNMRKIRELHRALAQSQRWKDIKHLFESFQFVEAFYECFGIQQSLKELNWILKEGKKSIPQMPYDCMLLIRHLIIFTRHRSPWISAYEVVRSMHPVGIWLQEFHNIPGTSQAVFAETIQTNLEDNWADILALRGGRVEYEMGWKPDVDTYGPIPITQVSIQCCAVSADGKWIVTGSVDGIVKVWNLTSGEEIVTLFHVASCDNTYELAKVSSFGGSSSTGPNGIRPSRAGVTFVAFSGEKPPSYIVSCAHDPDREPTIKLWPMKGNMIPKKMVGAHAIGSAIVRCEFLPPENRRLMSVGTDFNVVLWEVARCKIIRVIQVSRLDTDLDLLAAQSVPSGRKQSRISTVSPVKRKRLYPSGWPQVAGAVSANGLFAFGSASITVMDGRWKELLVKDLNFSTEKEFVRGHRLTSATFNTDGTYIFAASAVPPDDLQMVCVERQAMAERVVFKSSQESAPLHTEKSGEHGLEVLEPKLTQTLSMSCINSISVEAESEVKKAKLSLVRGWNISSGQQLLMFSIDDYIFSLTMSSDSAFLITAGAKGVITGWNSVTGVREFAREGHVNGVNQVIVMPSLAINQKKMRRSASSIEDDEIGAYVYGGMSAALSVSRSLVSLSVAPKSPLQLISCGNDNTALVWTLAGEHPDPGLGPVTSCTFSTSGEWLITVGGTPQGNVMKPNSFVRLWETSTATNRTKFEIPESFRTDIIDVTFIPNDDTRVLIGCRNGLVRIYKCRTCEVVKEFWADPELALSEATLGYKTEWPFALTGSSIVSYALHPAGTILAVAVIGQERFPTPAATFQDARAAHAVDAAVIAGLETAGLKDLAKLAGTSSTRKSIVTNEQSQEKSADMVLRDIVKITFWDLEGNPLTLSQNFSFPIFFNSADACCVIGPNGSRPPLTRRSQFVLKWSSNGKSLLASDDGEILKECFIDLKGRVVTGHVDSDPIWKGQSTSSATGPSSMLFPPADFGHDNSLSTGLPDMLISGATACSSIVLKDMEYICFAYGDGAIGLRSFNSRRRLTEIRWYLAHKALGAAAGDIVGCDYIHSVSGRGGYIIPPKIGDTVGVIVSASRNGSVLVQDAYSKEVCAVFNAGTTIKSMAVCSTSAKMMAGTSDKLRICLCKTDGTVAMLRYFA
ncbi:hypothetical protein HDU76_010614, partial [Blyttiomyces sp. JEL0837]